MDVKRAKKESSCCKGEEDPVISNKAREVKKLIESLTTSGSPTLDEKESKKVRKVCK